MLSSEELRALARRRVEDHRRSPGLAIGMISAAGRSVACAGWREAGGGRSVEPDTLFEIGSITKIFTAWLLADAQARGELNWSDPIDAYLPANVVAPRINDTPIRLLHLATHASGLPSFLDGAPPFDDSWRGYTREAFLADVAAFRPRRESGSAWKYSNSGYGLLGVALEAASGRPYGTLLRERILEPLGMNSTTITLTPALDARTASPHGASQAPGPQRIDISAMASAGAIWSSADDMLTFLAVATGITPSPLAPAFEAMLSARGPKPPSPETVTFEQALGWVVMDTPGALVIGHTGGTVGMGSAALADLKAREAVIVLGNAAQSPFDFAMSLLQTDWPVVEPPLPPTRRPIDLDALEIARLPGWYELQPHVGWLAEVDAKGLILRGPDAPRMRFAPYAKGRYFNPAYGAEAVFDLTGEGRAKSLTFTMGDQTWVATRPADR